MRGIRIIGLLVLAVLAGCGRSGMSEAELAAADADAIAAAAVQPTVLSRTSVAIYPDAVEVRLITREYAGQKVETDHGVLTHAQRQAIERTISVTHYGPGYGAVAACFIPHHFLQYYDASGRQVGRIAVCFCCTGISADPVIEAPLPPGADHSELTFDYEALKAILNGMGVPTNIECSEGEG